MMETTGKMFAKVALGFALALIASLMGTVLLGGTVQKAYAVDGCVLVGAETPSSGGADGDVGEASTNLEDIFKLYENTGNGQESGDLGVPMVISNQKKANTLKASAVKSVVSLKSTQVAKAKKTVKNVQVRKAVGKVTYANVSTDAAAKNFKVGKNGSVTVPKGTAKGTYHVKVKVKAKGNGKYKAGSKTVSFNIKVA